MFPTPGGKIPEFFCFPRRSSSECISVSVPLAHSSFVVVLSFEIYKGATQKASSKAYPSTVALSMAVCHILTILITSSASNIHFPGNKIVMILLAPAEHVYFTSIHLYNCFLLQETSFFIPNPPTQI